MITLILATILPTMSMATSGKPEKKPNLLEWLSKNLIYPTEAANNLEEGMVYISFTVTPEGKAENIKIKKGNSESLNKEALKAVESMPLIHLYSDLEPNKNFTLPIRFSIK